MRIPETLEEATSREWLAEALGGEVVGVTIGELDVRVTTNAPITVEFADDRVGRYWLKGYYGDAAPAMRSAGVPEAMFYRELADTTGMRLLRCAFADADPVTEAN